MITLDGSHGEGGGQILRTALSLSVLLNKPFEIVDIRKSRPEPGLKNQHLCCINAIKQMYNIDVEGAFLGSEKLKLVPGKQISQSIKADIGTAGSVTLLLQSLLLPCLFTPKIKNIELTGGTDVSWSPQIDYFNSIILPHLSPYAEKISLNIEKRGYYPKGSGKITLKIKPKYNLENLNTSPRFNLLEQGDLLQIKGISHASKDLQGSEVAERQARSAKLELSHLKVPIHIDTSYSETLSSGSGITLWALFSKHGEDRSVKTFSFSDEKETGFSYPGILGSDVLGERSKPAENIGKEAASKLLYEILSKSPVDQHLADNLIPFLALVKGSIKTSKITAHTKTNIYACNQFLGDIFEIEGNVIRTK